MSKSKAFYDLQTKLGRYKAVLFGDYLEVYDFKRGFLYNVPPPNLSHERSKLERRSDNLAKTRNMIKRIVYANTTLRDKFVTLTFDDKKNNNRLNTIKEGNRKFTLFIQRLKNKIGKFKYIGIPEFGKNGTKRLHYHMIFFDVGYLDYKFIEKTWGKGMTNVTLLDGKSVKSGETIKYIGHYIAKELNKLNYDKRLAGEKAYFTSRGLVRPVEYKNVDTIKNILYNVDNNYKLINKNKYNNKFLGEVDYKLLIKKNK